VVLLFDIWHPDLKKKEIEEIQTMFGKVEALANKKV
jgi:hypothetical protein